MLLTAASWTWRLAYSEGIRLSSVFRGIRKKAAAVMAFIVLRMNSKCMLSHTIGNDW